MSKKMKKWIQMTSLFLAFLLVLWAIPQSYGSVQVNAEVTAEELNPSLDMVLSSVKNYILTNDTNPDFNSCWNVVGLSRSGLEVPQSYKDTFYTNVIAYLNENDWNITRNKYSEYSKLIVALTASGKNAQNVEGKNLLFYLSDFNNVKRQGINGPIWALIALKCHPDYVIPENAEANEQTTEEGIIQYILGKEMSGGGWALSGNVGDADITGMVLQAFSSYYGKRNDVTMAVDRAVEWLSNTQLTSGGFATLGVETSESVSQIIVGLSSLGIDCGKDSRFVKQGKWPMTGLFQYYLSDEGGFMHVHAGSSGNGGGEPGKLDGMATEQGLYASVAYKRFLDGKTALYDMSDISFGDNSGDDGNISTQTPSDTTATNHSDSSNTSTSGQTETVPVTPTDQEEKDATKIKVIGVSLDYSKINLKEGESKTLKATVTPSNATNTSLKWSSSNEKVATVTGKGKVTGGKAGTAKITAASKDGTKIKAVCEVTVTASKATATKSTGNQSSTKKVTLKKTTSATSSKAAESESEITEENSGWSLDVAEYVPETGSESSSTMTEEAWKALEDKLMNRMDGLYLLVVGLYLFDKVIMFLYKKIKTKKGRRT